MHTYAGDAGDAVNVSIAVDELSQVLAHGFIWMEALDRRMLGTVSPVLTTGQYHALVALAQAPGMGVAELAARLLTVKSNASGIVDRLESLGLVSRHQDETDNRRVRLELTQLGKATIRIAVEARQTALTQALQNLAPADLGALLAGLRDVVLALQSAVNE
jgi:DNA-binding MarR family transcriptional regulator